MKTSLFILSVLYGLTLSLAAQNAAPNQGSPSGANAKVSTPTGLGGPDLFKTADTNGDGSINLEEFRQHRSSHSGTSQSATGTADVGTASHLSFEALDANADGKLSPQEFAGVAATEWRSDKGGGGKAAGGGQVNQDAR